MSSANHEVIEIYVDLVLDPSTPQFQASLKFYKDAGGTSPLPHGDINVKSEGAMIAFYKLARPLNMGWTFHDLTIHPVGSETSPVSLKWMVTDDRIVLHDPGQKRTFAYAISIESEDKNKKKTKWYFDPQLVNEGGGNR